MAQNASDDEKEKTVDPLEEANPCAGITDTLTPKQWRILAMLAVYGLANLADIKDLHEEIPFEDLINDEREAYRFPTDEEIDELIDRIRKNYGCAS